MATLENEASVPITDTTEEKIAEQLAALVTTGLGLTGTLTADADLRSLPDVDSLRLLRVLAEIEDEFDVALDDTRVFDIATLRDLAGLIWEARE